MRRFLFVFLAVAGLYAAVAVAFLFLTDVSILKNEFPVVHYDRVTKKGVISFSQRRPKDWVGLDQVSEIARATILLSEDSAFYQHNGFDWNQIELAFRKNWEKQKFARGGSTISQQVVKNVFLSSHKSLWRKIQEAILTVRLEREVRKRRILEVYLNIAEFGEGLYGISAAAQFYFKKTPAQLNAKEGAFLAMLLPSPKRYSVSFRKKELSKYADSVIQDLFSKLVATARLTEEESRVQLAPPLLFETAKPAASIQADKEEEEQASDDDD